MADSEMHKTYKTEMSKMLPDSHWSPPTVALDESPFETDDTNPEALWYLAKGNQTNLFVYSFVCFGNRFDELCIKTRRLSIM